MMAFVIDDFDLVLAEQLLAQVFEGTVVLQPIPQDLDSRHVVQRLLVVNAADNPKLPVHIIFKQFRIHDPAPAPMQPLPRELFFAEWSGLQLLNHLKVDRVPLLYESNESRGFLILQDLGEHTTLLDVFLGDDRAAATAGLLEFAPLLARIHGMTHGRETHYQEMKAMYPSAPPLVDSALDLRTIRPLLQDALEDMEKAGLDPIPDLISEISALETALHDSSLFRALLHADAGVHNVILLQDGVAMIDFEHSQFDHALLDVAGVRLGFPQSAEGHPLPPALIAQFESVYRSELAKFIPQAADDKFFNDGLVNACGHWVMVRILGAWRQYLKGLFVTDDTEATQEAEGTTTRYEGERAQRQLLVWLMAFQDIASTHGRLPNLLVLCEQIVALLKMRFPDLTPMEVFPALREPRSTVAS